MNNQGDTIGFGQQNNMQAVDQNDFIALQQQVSLLQQAFDVHFHDGILGQRINLFDLFGSIKVVKTSGELTNVTAASPVSPYEQFFLYVNGGTLRFYIYDITAASASAGWHYVTLTA